MSRCCYVLIRSNASSVESHATMGAMERASRTLGEMLHTVKHATEM